MKANLKIRKNNDKGFTFLVPFTLALVVTILLLVVGNFIIGVIGDTIVGSYNSNLNESGTWSYRNTNENATVDLIGNITEGFSDVVDIEIVVMIIVALSMAIFTVMALGTGRRAF